MEQVPGISHYTGGLPDIQLPSCITSAQSLDIVGSKKFVKHIQLVVGAVDVGVQWPQLVHLHSGQVLQSRIDGGEKYIDLTYPGKYHVMMFLLLTMRYVYVLPHLCIINKPKQIPSDDVLLLIYYELCASDDASVTYYELCATPPLLHQRISVISGGMSSGHWCGAWLLPW